MELNTMALDVQGSRHNEFNLRFIDSHHPDVTGE